MAASRCSCLSFAHSEAAFTTRKCYSTLSYTKPAAAGQQHRHFAEAVCHHLLYDDCVGIGNGARVAAVVGTKCRGTIAGFALLSYPLEVGLLLCCDIDDFACAHWQVLHKTNRDQCTYMSKMWNNLQEPEPMPPGKGRRNVEATPGPPDSVSTPMLCVPRHMCTACVQGCSPAQIKCQVQRDVD